MTKFCEERVWPEVKSPICRSLLGASYQILIYLGISMSLSLPQFVFAAVCGWLFSHFKVVKSGTASK